MVAYIYQKLLEEGVRAGQTPARTRSARNWFRNLARQTTGVQPNTIIKTAPKVQLTRVPQVGFMYHFFYEPKMRDELPYYDRFPLVIAVDKTARGFTGLNLHYIAPRDRVKLLDALYDNLYNEDTVANTRIKVTYELLTSVTKMRFAKPCFKKYLAGHIKGTIRRVSAEDWDIVSMLPFQNFTINANTVYAESRKKY